MPLPRFTLEPDSDTGRYIPATIHARLVMHDATGAEQPVPMDVVSTEVAPDDIVTIRPLGPEGDGFVLTFEVTINDSVLADADFATKVADPLELTFVARPHPEGADDEPPPEIRQRAEIVIEVPDGKIHWIDEDHPEGQDVELHLDADGESELKLRVWYEEYDPESRQAVYDAEKVEFTHWTGPETTPDVFNAAPDDRPAEVAGSNNNRDRTRWKTLVPLPSPEHDLVPPISTHIRVRVWPRGKIQRYEGGITGEEGHLAEVEVPVVLEPVKALAELVEPTEPIPADGTPVTLTVRLTNERTGAPIRSGTFRCNVDAPGRGGRLEPAEVVFTLEPEHDGRVELEYVPPELTYEPGKDFDEFLVVGRGSGTATTEIARLALHLSPEVELTLEAEKPGLEFEPGEVFIDAGESPRLLRGTLQFEITNSDPDASRTTHVAHARLTPKWGPNEVAGKPVTTDEHGAFELALPELADALAEASEERAVTVVDEDDLPVGELDEDAEEVISFFETKVRDHAPFSLYDAGLTREVRSHRLDFGRDIAVQEVEMLERILAGCHLYRTGVSYGAAYERMYRNQLDQALDQLAGLFGELLGIAMNAVNWGDRLAGAASGIVSWVETHTSSLVQRGIRWITTDMASGLQSVARVIRGWLDTLDTSVIGPAMRNLVEGLRGAWSRIGDALTNLTGSQRSAGEVVAAAIDVVVNVVKAVGNTIKAAVMWLLYGVGRGISGLAGWVGEALEPLGADTFVRWMTAIRQTLHNTMVDPDSWGTWGFGKLMEELYKWILDQLAALPRAAAATGAAIRERLDPIGPLFRKAVWNLDADVAKVADLPSVADPTIDAFRDLTSKLGEAARQWEVHLGDTEAALQIFDTSVLCIEIVVALGATIGTWGAGAAATGATFTQIEIALGVVKAVGIRLPNLGLTLLGGVMILNAYGTTLSGMARTTGAAAGASP